MLFQLHLMEVVYTYSRTTTWQTKYRLSCYLIIVLCVVSTASDSLYEAEHETCVQYHHYAIPAGATRTTCIQTGRLLGRNRILSSVLI